LRYRDLGETGMRVSERQKPEEKFFSLAEERNVGIPARVPLASGLLSGKMRSDRVFTEDDHRNFNREGLAFDKEETFAGAAPSGPLSAIH
jgi:aryl-alcohol dehydrogenase-like predicted oxidoreductase